MRSRFTLSVLKPWVSTAIWCAATMVTSEALAERVAFRNGIIHGSYGTNGVDLSKATTLIVNDGKIESIDAEPGRVDQTIDLKGTHLFPGMIALNTALGLSEISGVRSTRDVNEVGDFTPEVQSWIAVNPDSELIPVARANGIAYIQPAPNGGVISGQSGLVALTGWTMEEMAIEKPVALHLYWPNMELNTTPKEKSADPGKWKSLEDQAQARAKKIKELDEFFGDARAYLNARKADKASLKSPAWEAMVPYITGKRPVMVHADDIRQIKAALEWSETNKVRIIIAGGRDAWRLADDLAKRKVPVLFEHTFTQPSRDSDDYDVHYKAPAVLHKAGVPFAIGMGATTFDAALIKNVPYQAAQSIGYGLSREEALKAITLYPAQFIGMADRIGSIDVGKDATFFAADGDILDIRTKVLRMWIAGKEVSLDNRNSRLYEKYKARPRNN